MIQPKYSWLQSPKGQNTEAKKLARQQKKNAKKKKEVEDLTDGYVSSLIARQFGSQQARQLPKEVLEVKRAIVIIKRLNKTVKKCPKHGPLKLSQVNKVGKYSSGGFQYACKRCHKVNSRNHYLKNKDKIYEKRKPYLAQNIEKVREYKYRSWLKNKDKNKTKKLARHRITNRKSYYRNIDVSREKANINRRKCNAEMTDGYIRRLLTKHGKYKYDEVTPEMIAVKRDEVIKKRALKLSRSIIYDS